MGLIGTATLRWHAMQYGQIASTMVNRTLYLKWIDCQKACSIVHPYFDSLSFFFFLFFICDRLHKLIYESLSKALTQVVKNLQ